MKRIVWLLVTLALLAVSAAVFLRPKQPPGAWELHLAFGGREPASARDVRFLTGGLREFVVNIFFHAERLELERTLNAAPFERDVLAIRSVDKKIFSELSGMALPQELLGFARSDLNTDSHRYCYVVTDPSYSFAFVTYVEN